MTKLSCGDHHGLIVCYAQCPCLINFDQISKSTCRGRDETLHNRPGRPDSEHTRHHRRGKRHNSIPTFTLLPQGTLAGQPQQMGKSREQVRQELIEAQRQGLIPNTEADYPPSQRSIDANKARHAAVQRYWAEND
ncbi:DUF4148 domain-containing protein [Paraburkholderia sediminicola]|uniref:DUF4148 domain-containing protein n=1 Tax=Paraburkholderia sediminicola TaxID=458836 RepID=UPI0038BAE8D7